LNAITSSAKHNTLRERRCRDGKKKIEEKETKFSGIFTNDFALENQISLKLTPPKK